MCGINGYFSLGSTDAVQSAEYIPAMNRRISHRGPDDRGTWSDESGRVHFGHLRLSIIDLSPGGHQPMKGPDGSVIVFNGEIFNYKEIKAKHFANVQLHSDSDTEIILKLYERFGVACLEHLSGMFAFAIWDPRKEELFLARDRSGKKPLYFSRQAGIFAFSSEIKSLLELPWIKRELDEEAMYHFLTYNLLPPPMTMFRDIQKFHPAHYMIVGKDGIKSYDEYWNISYQDLSSKNDIELEQGLMNRLNRSVDLRMVSDVPVGAFLSGGVDSSAIVALMSERTTTPIKTYSVGFEGQPDYNELKFAASVASRYKTEHHEQIIRRPDIEDFLPGIAEIFDEPLADATCIPIYFISQKAREQGSIVVLTGDGSDELFAGYRNWQRYLKYYPAYRSMSQLPVWLRKGVASAYSIYNSTGPVAEILNRSAMDQEFFWGGAKSFKESTKRNFLSAAFNHRHPDWNSYSVIDSYRQSYLNLKSNSSREFSDVDWMCYLGYKFIIPNYYLYRMDRLGMANSIEIRTPFLDSDLINYALSLPGEIKTRNGEPKYILKKSLESILPHDILYRKKMGFCVPLREWAGELMLDYIEQHLKEFCDKHPAFDYSGLKGQTEKLASGDEQVTNTLWTIYFLMSWFNKWFP